MRLAEAERWTLRIFAKRKPSVLGPSVLGPSVLHPSVLHPSISDATVHERPLIEHSFVERRCPLVERLRRIENAFAKSKPTENHNC